MNAAALEAISALFQRLHQLLVAVAGAANIFRILQGAADYVHAENRRCSSGMDEDVAGVVLAGPVHRRVCFLAGRDAGGSNTPGGWASLWGQRAGVLARIAVL